MCRVSWKTDLLKYHHLPTVPVSYKRTSTTIIYCVIGVSV